MYSWYKLKFNGYIPSPAKNIDTSVNEAFTADKLNATKSYVDITDCWQAHYKLAKTFQSSSSHYDGVDRQIEPYCYHCSSFISAE